MAAIESRSALRHGRSFFQLSARMRSELSRTIGTSPFQPPVAASVLERHRSGRRTLDTANDWCTWVAAVSTAAMTS